MLLRHVLSPSLLAAIALAWSLTAPSQAQAPAAANAESNDPAALRAEIERLKSIMPGQSLAMTQVAYNFNNLWFAAHAGNWPLAQFYFGDARAGCAGPCASRPCARSRRATSSSSRSSTALEKTQLAKLGETIMAKDVKQFEAAYRATLEGCHACHTASEKPYLAVAGADGSGGTDAPLRAALSGRVRSQPTVARSAASNLRALVGRELPPRLLRGIGGPDRRAPAAVVLVPRDHVPVQVRHHVAERFDVHVIGTAHADDRLHDAL